MVGTSQQRAVYENTACGPTQIIDCAIQNQNYQDFYFVNASVRAKQPGPQRLEGSEQRQRDGGKRHDLYNGHSQPWAAPTRVELTPTTDTLGQRFWISAKTATTFTITANAAPI